MLDNQDQPCEILPWDTDFFGFRIARARGDKLDPKISAAIDGWCIENQIRCLYLCVRADDALTMRCAESGSYRLVDVRIALSTKVATAIELNRPLVRAAEERDLAALKKIASSCHSETRFWYDDNFDPQMVRKLYETWISRSCQGYADRVFVVDFQGQIGGYITCHGKPGAVEAQIGLLAVAEGFRGRGVAIDLVQTTLNRCAQQKIEVLSVTTQGRNIAAQCLYQRCGFILRSVNLFYHKWF